MLKSLVIKLFWTILASLPGSAAYNVGRAIGLILYHCRLRRKVVEKNYRQFCKFTGKKFRQSHIREIYQTVAGNMLEFPAASSKPAIELSRLIDLDSDSEANLKKLTETGGLILGAHHGSWELMIMTFSSRNPKYATYVAKIKNETAHRLINKSRKQFGTEFLTDRKTFLRKSLKLISNNYSIGLACDQHDPSNKMTVKFFGRLATFPQGIGFITYKTLCPVYFSKMTRLDSGRYQWSITELVFDRSSKNRNDFFQEIGDAYNKKLEEVIRQDPCEYFWFHKKYKFREEGETADFYD